MSDTPTCNDSFAVASWLLTAISVKYGYPVGSKKCESLARAEVALVGLAIRQQDAAARVKTGFELFTKEKRRVVRKQLALAMEEGGREGTKVSEELERNELAALWNALDPDEREAWNDLSQN